MALERPRLHLAHWPKHLHELHQATPPPVPAWSAVPADTAAKSKLKDAALAFAAVNRARSPGQRPQPRAQRPISAASPSPSPQSQRSKTKAKGKRKPSRARSSHSEQDEDEQQDDTDAEGNSGEANAPAGARVLAVASGGYNYLMLPQEKKVHGTIPDALLKINDLVAGKAKGQRPLTKFKAQLMIIHDHRVSPALQMTNGVRSAQQPAQVEALADEAVPRWPEMGREIIKQHFEDTWDRRQDAARERTPESTMQRKLKKRRKDVTKRAREAVYKAQKMPSGFTEQKFEQALVENVVASVVEDVSTAQHKWIITVKRSVSKRAWQYWQAALALIKIPKSSRKSYVLAVERADEPIQNAHLLEKWVLDKLPAPAPGAAADVPAAAAEEKQIEADGEGDGDGQVQVEAAGELKADVAGNANNGAAPIAVADETAPQVHANSSSSDSGAGSGAATDSKAASKPKIDRDREKLRARRVERQRREEKERQQQTAQAAQAQTQSQAPVKPKPKPQPQAQPAVAASASEAEEAEQSDDEMEILDIVARNIKLIHKFMSVDKKSKTMSKAELDKLVAPFCADVVAEVKCQIKANASWIYLRRNSSPWLVEQWQSLFAKFDRHPYKMALRPTMARDSSGVISQNPNIKPLPAGLPKNFYVDPPRRSKPPTNADDEQSTAPVKAKAKSKAEAKAKAKAKTKRKARSKGKSSASASASESEADAERSETPTPTPAAGPTRAPTPAPAAAATGRRKRKSPPAIQTQPAAVAEPPAPPLELRGPQSLVAVGPLDFSPAAEPAPAPLLRLLSLSPEEAALDDEPPAAPFAAASANADADIANDVPPLVSHATAAAAQAKRNRNEDEENGSDAEAQTQKAKRPRSEAQTELTNNVNGGGAART